MNVIYIEAYVIRRPGRTLNYQILGLIHKFGNGGRHMTPQHEVSKGDFT